MVENLEIEVPSSLSDITLRQYMKWVKVVEANKDGKDSEFLDRKLVECFCDLTMEQVNAIKYSEFDKILEVLSKALSDESDGIVLRFTLNDVEYGFEPDMEQISTAVYIDAESGFSEWDKAHQSIAALYRPITHSRKAGKIEQYETEEYNSKIHKASTMLDAPIDVVLGARVFFYTLRRELWMIILTSLSQKTNDKELNIQKKVLLEQSGDGIKQYILSLTESIKTSMRLPEEHYSRHLIT